MNNFKKCENKGRKLLKEILDQSINVSNQHCSEGDYDRVDYYFDLLDKKVVAEIKVRDTSCHQYNTLMMEVDKYFALVKDRQDKNLNCSYYINFIGEDTCYWFPTNKIYQAKREWKWCPKVSAYKSEYKYKECFMIPKEWGVKFVKVNGKWIKQEN